MTGGGRQEALRALADAALAIGAAGTVDDVLAIVADAARAVVGTRRAEAVRADAGAPEPGALTVPLVARDGSRLGSLRLAGKRDGGAFREADAAVLVPLAQLAANAIETIELLGREQAAREEAEALARVGSAITARLELQEIVQLATDAARELTPAAFGAFFYNVLSEAGESYMLYTLSGVEREAFSRFPMPRNTEIFAPTFNGDGIVRIADVLADPRYGRNAPYHGMPAGHLPVRSYLAVPVVLSDGDVAGGLFFGNPQPGMFSEQDERMVSGIAAQAAIAIENARLYERRIRDAQTLQRALLPPHLPAPPGVTFAAGYRPAGEGDEIGGDFYDAFDLSDGSWAIVVGDVCGKGPGAAAVTALARYTLRAHAGTAHGPAGLLGLLNDALLRQRAPGFCTVLMARLTLHRDGARLELTSAGHPLPVVVRAGGGAEVVGRVGTPVGVLDDPDLPELTLDLGPGDLVVLYTDGVTDAAAPRVLLAATDVASVVAEHAAAGPAAVVAALERTALELSDGHPRDDIACLALALDGSS